MNNKTPVLFPITNNVCVRAMCTRSFVRHYLTRSTGVIPIPFSMKVDNLSQVLLIMSYTK